MLTSLDVSLLLVINKGNCKVNGLDWRLEIILRPVSGDHPNTGHFGTTYKTPTLSGHGW